MSKDASAMPSQLPPLGGGRAWWTWILAVTFVVFLFSFQTG